MSGTATGILIIGYGNPGRQDDGLGPALADALERLGLPGVTVESDYQLTVEHAEMAARHRVVVFADATVKTAEPFRWNRVEPGTSGIRFTSHHLGPSDVLAIARDVFSAEPEGYVLAVRGQCFDAFQAGLSPEARSSLEQAVEFLRAMSSELRGSKPKRTCHARRKARDSVH
ncbi:MAG: hydrogenase maturation protease [Planctomycetaceae bacterium]|nr:hydrogenase maturation protease [Planctomycetaceae bacterium]